MLNNDFKEFLKLLNQKKVNYLLVGGYAVILHGYPRYTGDIDFWIEPTHSNAQKVIDVLIQFGFGSLNLTTDDFTKPDQIIQLGNEPFRIVLITSGDEVNFRDCYSQKKKLFHVDDIPIKNDQPYYVEKE